MLETALDFLAEFARRLWPGLVGAALGGYLGTSSLGFPGFLVASAVGALAGTYAAARFHLAPIRPFTGSRNTDLLINAGGAFALIALIYVAVQFAFIIAAIVAIVVIAGAWLSN